MLTKYSYHNLYFQLFIFIYVFFVSVTLLFIYIIIGIMCHGEYISYLIKSIQKINNIPTL